MAIYRLLQDAPFTLEEVARIAAAYEGALQLLRLTDRDDPVTQIVAKKIIEVAQSGVKDPPHMCARALKELGIELPD